MTACTRRDFIGRMLASFAEEATRTLEQTVASVQDAVAASLPGPELPDPLLPPGALPLEEFREACTRCDACIAACPHGAIRKAGDELGPHAGYPVMTPVDAPCKLCPDMPCVTACVAPADPPVRPEQRRSRVSRGRPEQRRSRVSRGRPEPVPPSGRPDPSTGSGEGERRHVAFEPAASASSARTVSGPALRPVEPHDVRIGIAEIDPERCYQHQRQPCDYCVARCPLGRDAIRFDEAGLPEILDGCTGCGQCAWLCPAGAIAIVPQ